MRERSACSEPEPDIAIVHLPDSAYSARHPAPQDIFWIIELAKTSLKKDLEIKAAIYAMAEIQEYWVVDLSAKQMIVFKNPQEGKYVEEHTIREGMITPLAFVDVSVSVKKFLS